jgi:hypothetical protein
MVKERKNRVGMSKQLKKEVFTACLVRMLHRTQEFGAFKTVGGAFDARTKTVAKQWSKTVAKQWYTTLKLLQGVPGYQFNAPIGSFVVLRLLLKLLRPNFQMLEENHNFTMTLGCKR